MKFHSPGFLATLLALSLLGGVPLPVYPASDDYANAVNAEAGGDASDDRAEATVLEGPGVYTATFTDKDDIDWFRLDVTSDVPICVSARIAGHDGVKGAAKLAAAIDALYTATDAFDQNGEARLSFLLPGGSATFLGLQSVNGGGGGYDFILETMTREAIADENTLGTDAGNSQATAVSIPTGCIAGELDPNLGDNVDWFKFDAERKDLLVVASTSTDPNTPITLFAPDGTEIVTLFGIQVEKVEVTQTGTHYLRVGSDSAQRSSTEDAIDYEVSVTDDNGPCRPYCVEL